MGQPLKLHRFLCTLALPAALVVGTLVPPAAAQPVEVLPLSSIERGQVGYGLSVFEGHRPTRFDFEVIGVWENVQPGTSYILAKLSGQNLENSGVIAGMSGSPVFIGDRLVGAVSFAWPFSKEAVAGITPIESMRRLVGIEAGPRAVSASQPVSLEMIASHESARQALEDGLAMLRPARMEEGTAAVQWTASGFGESSRRLLQDGLGAISSAGSSPGFSGSLEPGAAVAAVLIDGDLRLASSGTVTDRIGDTVLAFGHPFMGLGSTRIPMASAEVVTVISSLANSFKITNLGEVVGAFDFDHAVGIRGQMGEQAPVVPLKIVLRGSSDRIIDVRLADLERMTPVLAAVAVLGALDSATEAVGSEGLDLDVSFDIGDAGRLEVDQSFDGQSSGLDAALFIYSLAGYLMNNNLEDVDLASIEVELTRYSKPRTLRLVEAHAARSVVRPGDTVEVSVDLAEYRGRTLRQTVDVQLPTNLPSGKYSLLVGDGASIDAAKLAIEPVEPVTFSQALDFLNSLHSRRELMVLGVFSERGLSVAGEALPRLPASVRSLWSAAPSGSAKPLRLAIGQQQLLRLENPVDGIVRIDLIVERPRPWAATEDQSSGAVGQSSSGVGDDPTGGKGSDELAVEKSASPRRDGR